MKVLVTGANGFIGALTKSVAAGSLSGPHLYQKVIRH